MLYFEDIINEIENNITGDIDIAMLARKLNMSLYEFRRIFTFITKISIGEYIRKRKLSLAALELYEKSASVSEIAGKYGYDSPSSFSRAFKEYHNISPSEVVSGNLSFKLLTKISAEITATGGEDIDYRVFESDAFTVSGYKGYSDLSDSQCCEKAWSEFYESPCSDKIESDKIYAAYLNGDDSVCCVIGQKNGSDGEILNIPASKWAGFKLIGTDDEYVDAFYGKILGKWFASSGYERNEGLPNIEVYPVNMDNGDFEWEIHIPIRKVKHE